MFVLFAVLPAANLTAASFGATIGKRSVNGPRILMKPLIGGWPQVWKP
jgi:hypothetical protein